MGEINNPRPVLLFVAAFSRHPQALQWARHRLLETFGEEALASDPFDFDQTNYYESSMGCELTKQYWTYESLIDPATLPQVKRMTNGWEQEYAQSANHPESRPLNLDPGYVTEAKLVLATTKDRDHRLYLAEGIYAEGTLFLHRGEWRERPWTYPDYKLPSCHAFLTRCRDYLRKRYQTNSPSG